MYRLIKIISSTHTSFSLTLFLIIIIRAARHVICLLLPFALGLQPSNTQKNTKLCIFMRECAAEQFSSQFVKAKQINKQVFFSFFPFHNLLTLITRYYSKSVSAAKDERIWQIKISLGRDYRLKLCIKSWDNETQTLK